MDFLCTKLHKYEKLKAIGNGGSSDIFEVKREDGAILAAKVFKESDLKRSACERFRKEIEFQNSQKSKFIVKALDYKVGKKQSFYIMKKYDTNFEEMIDKKKIPKDKLLKYFLDVCRALKYAHKRNIIHRDIKPKNMLYDKDLDRLMLADFGIAHFPKSEITSKTRLANFDYKAPEQSSNCHKTIGKFTDIYSMGLILNKLFTGEIPNGFSFTKIVDVSPYYESLDSLVERMIMADINKRESNINNVINILNTFLEKTKDDNQFIGGIKIIGENEHKEEILKQVINDYKYVNNRSKNFKSEIIINQNYHCNIHYQISQEAFDTLMLIELHQLVCRKFKYESGALKISIEDFKNKYSYLENDDAVDYKFIETINSLKCLPEAKYLKNETLNFFMFIHDYHRKEVLNSFEQKMRNEERDVPIIIVAQKIIKMYVEEEIEFPFSTFVIVDLIKSDWQIQDFEKEEVDYDEIETNKMISEIEKSPSKPTVIKASNEFLLNFSSLAKKSAFIKTIQKLMEFCKQTNEIFYYDCLDVIDKIDNNDYLSDYDLKAVIIESLKHSNKVNRN